MDGEQLSNNQDPNAYSALHDELNKNFVVRPMPPDKVTEIPARTNIVVVDGSLDLPPSKPCMQSISI